MFPFLQLRIALVIAFFFCFSFPRICHLLSVDIFFFLVGLCAGLFLVIRRSIGSHCSSANCLLSLTYCWTVDFLDFPLHGYKLWQSYAKTPCSLETLVDREECCKEHFPTTSLSLKRPQEKTVVSPAQHKPVGMAIWRAPLLASSHPAWPSPCWGIYSPFYLLKVAVGLPAAVGTFAFHFKSSFWAQLFRTPIWAF